MTTRSQIHRGLESLLTELNPLIRGWRNYYRHAVGASKEFGSLDWWLWRRIFRWLHKKHRGPIRTICGNGTVEWPVQALASGAKEPAYWQPFWKAEPDPTRSRNQLSGRMGPRCAANPHGFQGISESSQFVVRPVLSPQLYAGLHRRSAHVARSRRSSISALQAHRSVDRPSRGGIVLQAGTRSSARRANRRQPRAGHRG